MGPRGFAENDPLQFHVADAGDQLDVFEQIGKVIDDEGVGIGWGGVERLDHRAAADGAGFAIEKFFEVLIGPDEDAAIFGGSALAADGDFGARAGLGVVPGGIRIETLEELVGGAEEALAFFCEGFELGVGQGRGSEDIDGDHRIHDGLVAGVVDFEHDVRAEGFDRIEQDGAGVEAEVALALVEDDEVFLQIHRATREDARTRRDRERRGVVADLNLVDERAAGVAGNNVLEVEAREPRGERVVDLVRSEENAPAGVDGDGVGQLEGIGLDGRPDLGAG